ncbi:MAG: type IX secretion system protein PorQ [Marinilabiliaceae bacterium]|nr:type IX secretion system protein PorQ [Marinilabiliaceae bacterium]
MRYKFFILFTLLLSSYLLKAQRGGTSVFDLLYLPQSARIGALGGNQVGVYGEDLAMLINNPAMLDSALTNYISVSYTPYIADIGYGFAAFSHSFEKIGNFALNLYHVGYGEFISADETGLILGTFSVNESVIHLVYSRKILPRIHVGASIKPIFSRIEVYNSWGMAFDAGLFYSSESGLVTAGAVLRNVGRQINPYYETIESTRPDFQLGLSTKLAHAPFRFSITMQDIFSGSLLYVVKDEDVNPYFIDEEALKGSWGNDLLRRFVFGIEFVPTKNFYVAAGYNFRRRQEMKIEEKLSTVGFSWGFGVKVYKFNVSYGSARYHLAGTSNHFSISTSLNRW